MLSVGSHDGFIDLYSFKFSKDSNEGTDLKPLKRLKGHHSYVTHLDWSSDNLLLQSTCGAYEILYWSTTAGTQLLSTEDTVEADTEWGEVTCPLGFNVMGIWARDSDGTDVNGLSASPSRGLVVTADDFGLVKLFNYPCVSKDAGFVAGTGHSSHVMNVKFVGPNSATVASVGGCDCSVMLWNVVRSTGGKC